MLAANLEHLRKVQTLDVPALIKRQFNHLTNNWALVGPCIVNSDKCPIAYRYSAKEAIFSIDVPLSVWRDDFAPTCVWITVNYLDKICKQPLVTLRDQDDPFDHPRIRVVGGITRCVEISDLWTAAVSFTTLITTLAACLSAPIRPIRTALRGSEWLSVSCMARPAVRMHAPDVATVMRNLETSVVSTTVNYDLAHRGRWLDRSMGDAVPIAHYGITEYEAPLVVTFKPGGVPKIEEGEDY